MIHITTTDIKTHMNKPTVVTIGNFDGMHRGHMSLMTEATTYAKTHGLLSVVLSFTPHPRDVVNQLDVQHIFSSEEKRRFVENLGVDVFIEYPFDLAFASQSPQFFLEDILKAQLSPQAIFVGENYRFGTKGAGDVMLMQSYCAEQGIHVHIQPLLTEGDTVLCSSTVRQAILAGDMREASHILGRPFSVEAHVVPGDQRGRKMGFPTANIIPNDPKKILPKLGVYITRTIIDGETTQSITNVGYNPTFEGQHLVIETFILNFSRDIYDQHIEVQFLEHLRGEQKFDSMEALITQITQDVAEAKAYHGLV